MDKEINNNSSLEHIPVNRRMIDELWSHGLIASDARNYALKLIYREQNWGGWISHLLLILGTSLILAGIVYFFAFNWTKIPFQIKLASIQLAIFGCIIAAYFYGTAHLVGKVLLLSASVLLGVFLAVFGQIYQTGADAYSLFIMWGLLILPWVILSNFAALWLIWVVIFNVFLGLYWEQAVLPDLKAEMMLVVYLMLVNSAFLGLREWFVIQGNKWLQQRWTRLVLISVILVYAIIPPMILILVPSSATQAIVMGTVLSGIIHGVFYIFYRYKIPDISGIAVTILSGCIILELAILKMLTKVFSRSDSIIYLLLGCITLVVFVIAIIKLRIIAKEMETDNV